MQLSWCFSQSSLTGIKRPPFIMAALGPQFCTVWLTHDRWLLCGGRRRWTRSLNLPLYRASAPPFSTPTIFNNIDSVIPLHVCRCLKFVHLHSCFLSALRACTQYPISVQLWDEETAHSLHGRRSYPEFSMHVGVHTFRQGSSTERGGVKRSPRKHMCVSEISGWEWVDWDENRKRGWSGWEGEEGDYWGPASEKVTQGGRQMIDIFFFSFCSRAFSKTHTHTHTLLSGLSSCLRLFSITPSPASWSPSSSPIICSVFSLVFLFTCLIISPSSFFNRAVIGEHWTPMIQSHPYSLTSELFPSPCPGLHITQLCACRLCSLPLLFHTFCLAFKSSSFTYPPDLPSVKKKKVDMASQAKGLVSFLEPVTVHHSPIVITAETSSSGKLQHWWTRHYWQSPSLYLP